MIALPTAPRVKTDPWAPYAPSRQAPWDLGRVVHLHRAAGFAATWDELQRDLKDGPKASLDRLLGGRARGERPTPDFDRTADRLADAAVRSDDPAHLKAWWVYRMLFGPDPLGEKLTLLWHDDFATSNLKVDNLAAMRRQNEVLRQYARAPFGELLGAVLRDPALLVYLDAPSNRKGHPNENLARELMELFTLGIGHYTEKDVKEAARTLTGWTVTEGVFHEDPARHDDGAKTVLGHTGRWHGGGLLRLLREHPATVRRLASRICTFFLGAGVADATAVDALASGLRSHDLDVDWAVATVLRSALFFAQAGRRRRVLGPVEFVVGAVRALELFDPPPSTLVLADWAARLGQDLFYPPNVGGWQGGRSWLTTRALIGRANFAFALLHGKAVGCPRPVDVLALARGHYQGRSRDDVLTFFTRLFFGAPPDSDWFGRLSKALGSRAPWEGEEARRAVALILATPEAQLA